MEVFVKNITQATQTSNHDSLFQSLRTAVMSANDATGSNMALVCIATLGTGFCAAMLKSLQMMQLWGGLCWYSRQTDLANGPFKAVTYTMEHWHTFPSLTLPLPHVTDFYRPADLGATLCMNTTMKSGV